MHFAIVRVIQGEDFPADEGELRFKTTWGREEATMESVVCSTPNVDIHQEVAFQTSKYDERVLRLEQICLQCTYVLPDGTNFDFGKVDLSFYLNRKSNKKWYQLQKAFNDSTKKPSLLISTFCERNGENSPRVDGTITDQPGIKSTAVPLQDNEENVAKPMLINDDYFLIESAKDTGEQVFFNMSVTLSFAENLFNLFPSKSLWPPDNTPFDFRFNLFGSPIRFAPFQSLRNLTEIGERATAKIKGSPKSVLRFLKKSMQTLTILLCCEEIPIAQSIIPIKERIEYCQLENHILGRLHLEPVNISGIFPMSSLLEADPSELNSVLLKPQIGVVVTLSQIEAETTAQQPSNQTSSFPTPCSAHTSIVSSEPTKADSVTISTSTVKSSNRKRERREKQQEDLMYAAALELEVWKEEQKILEQEKQERSRAAYMELLNSEYRQQAAMKEAAFQRRVHRVEELENQLENAIQSTRQTEMELQQEKEYLGRQRVQLSREKTLVASEVERVTQSLSSKHKFELEAERRRHTEIVTELRRKLKAQIQKSAEDSRRITELEKELNNLKHQKDL